MPSPLALSQGWNQEVIEQPLAGLQVSQNPASLDVRQSPESSNLVVWPNVLRGDTGLDKIADLLPSPARICERFIKNDGTEIQIGVTDESIYVFDPDLGEWHYAFTNVTTTLADSYIATDDEIDVVDASNFSPGDKIGIILDSGSMHKTTVASVVSNTITLDDALPDAASAGNTVGLALTLHGQADIQPDFCQITSHDWFVVTNGVDTPFYHDGTEVFFLTALENAFTTFTARACAVFSNMLMFANTTENGINFPQRVRRSDTANPTEWVTGTAGHNDLFDTPGELKALKPLGQLIIAYKRDSIIRGEYIGSTTKLIDWITTVPSGYGAVSPRAVAIDGTRHYVIGYNDIYLYQGDVNARSLSGPLMDGLYGPTGSFGSIYDYLAEAKFVDNQKEAWFLVPDPDGNSNKIYRLHIPTNAWERRDLLFNVSCLGTISVTGGGSWASAEGTWTDQIGPWISTAGQGQAVPIALGNKADNTVAIYDYQSANDAGQPVRASFTSKAFVIPHKQLLLDRFDIFVKGDNGLVEFSRDMGNSWTTLKTFNHPVTAQRLVTFRQFPAKSLMLRISATMNTFELHWFAFTYQEESEETALF